MLRRARFRVVGIAADAEEALSIIESTQPDIITMDIRMPGMNGIELTRLIKSRYPAVKVVMVTAYGERESLYESLSAGASGFITKPFDDDDIIASVRAVIDGRYPIDAGLASSLLTEYSVNVQWPDGLVHPRLTTAEQLTLELLAQNARIEDVATRLNLPDPAVHKLLANAIMKIQIHRQIEDVRTGSRVVVLDMAESTDVDDLEQPTT